MSLIYFKKNNIFCLFSLFLLAIPYNCVAAFPLSEKKETEVRIRIENNNIEEDNGLATAKKDKGIWGIVSVIAGSIACASFGLMLKTTYTNPKLFFALAIITGAFSILGLVTGIIGRKKGRKHRELAKNGIIFGIIPPAIVTAILLLILGFVLIYN